MIPFKYKTMMTKRFTTHGTTLALWVLMGILVGCSPARQVQETGARQMATTGSKTSLIDDPTYLIRPGDEIEILVWEQPSFNTLTSVSSLGTIAMPLIGEMQVSGLSKDQLQRELLRRMGEFIRGDISLTVSIRNTDNLMVAVYGMVTRPDNYPVVDETSVFRILARAGGPTEEANIRSVTIYRKNGNPDAVTLDLTQYLDSGRMESPDVLVRPGDIIYIPAKQNAVREMSDFMRDVVLLFGIFRVFG